MGDKENIELEQENLEEITIKNSQKRKAKKLNNKIYQAKL